MRVPPARFRTAGLAAAAVTLLAAGASGCSGGSSTPGAVITPNLPSSAGSPSPSGPTNAPGPTLQSYDAGAALALRQQLLGCKTALGPLYSAVTNGSADQAKVLSVTPPAAKQAIQDSFAQLDLIMQQDPNALTDGAASKGTKPIDAFCATPAGVQLVGTTPATALKPSKPARTITHG